MMFIQGQSFEKKKRFSMSLLAVLGFQSIVSGKHTATVLFVVV